MFKKDKGLQESKTHSVKGPTQRLPHSKLLHRGSCSKSNRDICGGTKLTTFRTRLARAGLRATLSEDENSDKHHYSCVDPFFYLVSQHKWVPNLLAINLANTIGPTLVIL